MKLSYPVKNPRVSSPFGPRTGSGSSFHRGIDFGWNRRVEPVYAAADAVVVATYYSRGAGNVLSLRFDDGTGADYLHLLDGSVRVKKGQRVRRGKRIATMGNTGTQSFGRHLHFQYWVNGRLVDPAPYLSSNPTPAPTPEEDDLMAMRIIAPYKLPDRAVVGGGLAYAFPNEGEFKHFLNFNGLGTPTTVKIEIVGDKSMTEAQRRETFNTIIKIYKN